MMEYTDKEYCLEVWGDMACFTRPELKVERVSYDVITPSAARAIFEAIFWKPAIHWQITKIEVLKPIIWSSVRRIEVGAVAGKSVIFIEEKRQRHQQHTGPGQNKIPGAIVLGLFHRASPRSKNTIIVARKLKEMWKKV